MCSHHGCATLSGRQWQYNIIEAASTVSPYKYHLGPESSSETRSRRGRPYGTVKRLERRSILPWEEEMEITPLHKTDLKRKTPMPYGVKLLLRKKEHEKISISMIPNGSLIVSNLAFAILLQDKPRSHYLGFPNEVVTKRKRYGVMRKTEKANCWPKFPLSSWRLGEGEDRLWRQIIMAKYKVDRDGWDVHSLSYQQSALWRGVISVKDSLIQDRIRRQNHVLAWRVSWWQIIGGPVP